MDETLTEELEQTAASIKAHRQIRAFSVPAINATYFSTANTKSFSQPVKVQAFCLRADLDGFTKKVQVAFAVGTEEAISALVREFLTIMAYPDQFAKALNRNVISLPWAGDCATLLIPLRPGETYESARALLPPTAALAWHNAYEGEPVSRSSTVFAAMGEARWAVGIAGDLGRQSAAFNLTEVIRANLLHPGLLHLWPEDLERPDAPEGFRVGVRGSLQLTVEATDTADCHFVVPVRWTERMPQVMCHSPWLRQGGAEWHVFADGRSICWQFPPFWQELMSKVGSENDFPSTVGFAARWCLREVRSLLYKHLLADRMNLTAWSPEWPAWPHGAQAATVLYERLKVRKNGGGLFPRDQLKARRFAIG